MTLLGEFDYGYYGGGFACLTLGANDSNPSIPGYPAVQTGPAATDIVPVGVANDGFSHAGIGVGCDQCIVSPNDSVTFGAIKAMYR
jgi:hypothetical protein